MRYRKILVSGNILVRAFTEGLNSHVRCIKGLPEGTKFIYSIPDTYLGIWLVIEHPSFDMLKDGDLIPEFPRPEVEAIHHGTG